MLLTLNELFACRDHVRQHDRQEQEWDRDYDRKVIAAILQAIESNAAVEVAFTIEELWQTHRQVPSQLRDGAEATGRTLLLKVMRALRDAEQAPELPTEEEEPVETALLPVVQAVLMDHETHREAFERLFPAEETP